MALPFRTPGGERTSDAIVTLLWGGILSFVGFRFWSNPSLGIAGWLLLLLGLPLLASGVLLWFRRGWARWPAVVILGLLAAAQAWGLASQGFGWWRAFLLLALAWTAVDVYRHFSPAELAAQDAADESSGEGKPMISLALLLRRPRFLDAKGLASYCEAAWGGQYRVLQEADSPPEGETKEPRWVGGRSPLFLVGSPQGMFMVHNNSEPYFSEPEKMADQNRDRRLRQVLEENRAWLAVDLMVSLDPTQSREAHYPAIAQLIAALAGPECQAIYRPETGQFNHWDDSLEEKLKGPNALELFAEPTRLPVIEVPDDDPRMVAAVAEARQRWPEFVAAFQARSGNHFSVKAPISRDGNTEFIWIEVDELQPDQILGRLGNDPVDLGGMKSGDPVSVPISKINDWVYLQEEQPFGMFTVKVLQELQRTPPPAST
ncbi:MAG: DUF2314 domain-containing protein [Verrucomicrobia bacterium]|nr:DUF2314 domain-containing protein [Verrucomicrobiota bacterium]